ncbi:MAG: hypothetical protein K6F25_01150 [Bacteroidales bacterium]|nr:hypothetical protein [Bacteroidales bacterium]
MKHAGSTFEHEEARNRDLMRAYKAALAESCGKSAAYVYKKVAESPAERFWVSEERAAIVISDMFKGRRIDRMRPNKREMYEEIYRRVLALKGERPDESIYSLTFEVVQQQAPKFYLTPDSVRIIIHYIKKKWYEQRKRKYRHLLM